MSSRLLYVIGAGMAGLSAAVAGVQAGFRVSVHDSARQAGGRCRSFHDNGLDRLLDNGTHLMLSSNHAVRGLARLTGGDRHLSLAPALFPFMSMQDGAQWNLRPNAGRLPWWVAVAGRRVPGSRIRDYLGLLSLMRAPHDQTVTACLGANPLFRPLFEPLCEAILNTEPDLASAQLLGAVLRETLARGGAASQPLLATNGLSAALVDPTLGWLQRHEVPVHLGDGLESLTVSDGRVDALQFHGATIPLGPQDSVVLAVPPWAAARFLPSAMPRLTCRPIVNVHFLMTRQSPPMMGLIGGTAQWMFRRGDILSVTISAAAHLVDEPSAAIAARVWYDVARALNFGPGDSLPPWRVIKEKRATLAHTPAQEALRPGARTAFRNLWLAGDWTATGIPCTIEGAVRSGQMAVQQAAA